MTDPLRRLREQIEQVARYECDVRSSTGRVPRDLPVMSPDDEGSWVRLTDVLQLLASQEAEPQQAAGKDRADTRLCGCGYRQSLHHVDRGDGSAYCQLAAARHALSALSALSAEVLAQREALQAGRPPEAE